MPQHEKELPERDYQHFHLSALQHDIHVLACKKGWWDEAHLEGSLRPARPRSTVESLALITCEVAEAIECVRDGQLETTVREDGKLEGLPSEIADVVIRAFDLAGHLNIDLGDVLLRKHAYNATRSHRHGGKKL